MNRQKQKYLDVPGIKCHESSRQTYFGDGVTSVLFSRGKTSKRFFTEDSKKYITPKEFTLMQKGVTLNRATKKWDSIQDRVVHEFVRYQPSASSLLLRMLAKRQEIMRQDIQQRVGMFARQFTLVRVWNMSIVGAILFGMVTMTFIYRYLGVGASAQLRQQDVTIQQTSDALPKVLGDETTAQINAKEKAENEQRQQALREMVKGYPIENMTGYIVGKDPKVAAFLIAIAKKESGWGQHHPVLNGQDCYNYWGYRGQRKLMGTDGHTCFNSPKDAVDTVAKRIDFLVNKEGLDTPEKMILWKCGSDCNVRKNKDEQKWISDVKMYVDKYQQQVQN